jgi:glycine C-acetyltransferase
MLCGKLHRSLASDPIVPKDQACIRVQISAAHEKEHLDHAIAAFTKVGKAMNVI